MKVVIAMHERIQLEQEYSAKQSQLQAYNNQMTVLNNKITRVEKLKAEFVEHKSELIALQNKLKTIAKENYDYWIGDRLDHYQDLLRADLVNDSLSDYIKKIDQNLDELNNELMRLQNEVYSTEGLIGSIKSALNWLSTKIENLVN